MAIKTLMLRKKLDDKKKLLSALREKDNEFLTREAELEQSITEAETEEEKATVEEAVAKFDEEHEQHENDKKALENEIAGLEKELEEEERKAPAVVTNKNTRKDDVKMETRKFFNMPSQERDAFFAREDVKDFLQRTRDMGNQKREISGSELLIPDVVLGLIREEITNYSKLYKHVMVRRVSGTSRLNIMGKIPEGVWTEMCAKLNELSLSFTSVEVDGYKVGGYIAVCNAVLEDSDIALATEIINALSQAIGYALDKAILFGTGTKMPMGIATRLATAEAPAGYPATSRTWSDLTSSNILTLSSKTDAALFKAIVGASGAAKNGTGAKFWAMNEATYSALVQNAVSINAAGAIVTGMNNQMPIVGGTIEILPFMADGDIIGGYGQRYLLAERAGTAMARSEHVRFLEDQTVFKATARYDGVPVIAESFIAMNINGVAPTTSVEFAADLAN